MSVYTGKMLPVKSIVIFSVRSTFIPSLLSCQIDGCHLDLLQWHSYNKPRTNKRDRHTTFFDWISTSHYIALFWKGNDLRISSQCILGTISVPVSKTKCVHLNQLHCLSGGNTSRWQGGWLLYWLTGRHIDPWCPLNSLRGKPLS